MAIPGPCSVAKGDDLFQKAQKKLKGFSFFGGSKNEEAAEMLEKASNYYKLGKGWKEAVAAYSLLAEVQTKLDSKHDAANAYVEGAKCAMKYNPAEAVQLLQRAVDIYTDMGRLNMAARQLREIGEAQEKQVGVVQGTRPRALLALMLWCSVCRCWKGKGRCSGNGSCCDGVSSSTFYGQPMCMLLAHACTKPAPYGSITHEYSANA